MKVVEQFTQGKTGQDALNEDALVITDDYIVVMDGVTTKSCPKIGTKSAGRFAVDCAAAVIRKWPSDLTARQAVDMLGRALVEAVAEKVRLPADVDHPAFGIIAYSKYRREVWRVSDPVLIMDGIPYTNFMKLDHIASEARALMIEMALIRGMTESDVARNDVGRAFISPLQKDQHLLINRPGEYGYGVINGTPVPGEFIQIYDASKAQEIVFMSDGYPKPMRVLADGEAYLSKLLKEDPLLFRKYKSTKGLLPGNVSFDDRTFVRFTL